MSTGNDVNELFGEGEGAPEPRTALVWSLLVIGLLLSGLGMVCTPVPGAILVLLAWYLVEKELDRVSSGYLSREAVRPVTRARMAAFVSVLFVIVLFLVQGFLLGADFYDSWWSQLIAWWLQLAPPAPPMPDPSLPAPGLPVP
jgi:hypothetical protein